MRPVVLALQFLLWLPLPGAVAQQARDATALDPVAATLSAPEVAPVGATIAVGWSLSGRLPEDDDMIVVARPGDGARDRAAHAYPRRGEVELRLPLEPGPWAIRYLEHPPEGGSRILAERTILLTDIGVTLSAPSVVAGDSTFTVLHDGPGAAADYLTVARPGDADAAYLTYAYAGHAGRTTLVAPLTAGKYELRYVASGNSDRVLGRRAIEVVPVAITLSAPAAARAGSLLRIRWTGPRNGYDYIAIARPADPAGASATYVYTRSGNPAIVPLPLDPGRWEIRYVLNGEIEEVLARRPIEVTPVSATLAAPGTAVQGGEIAVAWSGPGGRNDFLAIARPGSAAARMLTYAYVADGSPLRLRVPVAPGDYELRYVASGDPGAVLARQPLRVQAAPVTLAVPQVSPAGGALSVRWTGPGNPADLVVVALPGDPPDTRLSAVRAVAGTPAVLTLPAGAGTYEIRYLVRGERTLVLEARQIELTAPAAALHGPADATIGAALRVDWSGPDRAGDRIVLARAGAPPGDSLDFRFTRSGNPALIAAPTDPGAYELRYVAAGDPAAVIARQPLRIAGAAASLDAPAAAGQGAHIVVGWTGPGNPSDRIALALPDAPAGAALHAVKPEIRGSARLVLPNTPGRYEIRYLLRGVPDDRILARREIEVAAAPASLSAPAVADAGSTVAVHWTGPDHPGDLIVLATPGSGAGDHLARVRTGGGDPALLPLPLRAGSFELRYVARGSPPAVLAATPIRLEPVEARIWAPARAPAGGALIAAWTGPGNRGDYLDVVRPGGSGGGTHAYVALGSPLRVPLPQVKGDYLLRYVGWDGTVLAERPLAIE